MPDKKVELSAHGVRLDSLFKKVKQQTGFIFSYNTRRVNHSLVIDLPPGKYSLEEILVKVKEKTGLDYAVAENHIILKPANAISPAPGHSASPMLAKKESVKTKQPAEVKKPVSTNFTATKIRQAGTSSPSSHQFQGAANLPVASKSPAYPENPRKETGTTSGENALMKEKAPDTSLKKGEIIKGDSVTGTIQAIRSPDEKTVQIVNPDSLTKPAVSTNGSKQAIPVKTSGPKKPGVQKVAGNRAFQVKAGLSTDETLYLGPAIQAGINVFYVTASYKTNFNVGMFSYGAGTSVKLNNTLRINIFGTTGNSSRHRSQADTSTFIDDSLHLPQTIRAKSTLVRAGFSFEKKLSPKFVLQAGLQFNSLTTHYSIDGLPPSDITLGTDPAKTFYTVRPPYQFKNSYNSTFDTNKKYWVGVQLSLLYVINFPRKG